jgi:hypothetical protein
VQHHDWLPAFMAMAGASDVIEKLKKGYKAMATTCCRSRTLSPSTMRWRKRARRPARARHAPSWNEGAAKSAIVDFVARVTKEGRPDYVPPAERIATFDNDGTLWCEQPLPVQGFFLVDRVKQLAAKDPSMNARQPFKAFLEHDHKTLHSLGKQGLMELFAATHDEEFYEVARTWFASAKHPKFGCLFTQVAYRPQVELLGYLRENGFKTYIVSGGGIDFIRVIYRAGLRHSA